MKTLLLTDAQLDEVQSLAGLMFSESEIITIMGLDDNVMPGDDFKKSFLKGKLIKQAELRKSIFDLAINGSSPAQILANDIIKSQSLNSVSI
jgi:hypothetical protein